MTKYRILWEVNVYEGWNFFFFHHRYFRQKKGIKMFIGQLFFVFEIFTIFNKIFGITFVRWYWAVTCYKLLYNSQTVHFTIRYTMYCFTLSIAVFILSKKNMLSPYCMVGFVLFGLRIGLNERPFFRVSENF